MTFWRFFTITTLMIFAMSASQSTSAKSLSLVANIWEPYTGNNLQRYGLASDIVTTALERNGYSVNIEIMPWARAYRLAENGEVDGIVGIWKTTERQQHFVFSAPYLNNTLVFIKLRSSSFEYDGFQSLSNKVVGIGRGYGYSDTFSAANNFRTIEVTSLNQSLEMLVKRRMDVAVSDKNIAQYYIANHSKAEEYQRELTFANNPLDTLPLHFGLNKQIDNVEEIIATFNEEIKRMRQAGEIRELYKVHGQE